MTDAEFNAYAAGFFDGEGHVTLRKGSYGLRVGLSQIDRSVLAMFQSRWGGTIEQSSKNRKRTLYQLMFYGKRAIPFLEAVRPYCYVKRSQVEIALCVAHAKRGNGRTVGESLARELWELNGKSVLHRFSQTLPG